MRGPKGELPKGDDGSYGSSITLHRALDPAYDVILAYKQNGRLLTPDHGFPLRVIIPGLIGGRMIKWLEEITVTAEESQNYYHFHDNRILPPNVDEEKAKAEGESCCVPRRECFMPGLCSRYAPA
jgi:nitrate reductase (NAD(P)H)